MTELQYDIAVVGSGFAGSLISMIARKQGRSVILLERGRHPRPAIGESSTPLSNLLLEELAGRYQLDEVAPLSKWGTWQQTHPDLACGLKRGFTFYHHDPEHPQPRNPDRRDQLLVAASPLDRIADTHWYRADFDHFLVQAAQRAGADYLDEVRLESCSDESGSVVLKGQHNQRPLTIGARFVVDATGPRGFLHRALSLGELPVPGMPSTQALYSHFSGVEPLSAAPEIRESPPYPPDHAAVHHVFPGGWVWVLHFNNGITSAGVAATDLAAARLGFSAGDGLDHSQERFSRAWHRLIHSIPMLREQFSCARNVQPFLRIQPLSFRSARIVGRNWALLPSAAGFVDPLLSTGFALTLLGVERLTSILSSAWQSPDLPEQLSCYAEKTDAELTAISRLLGALYASMDRFRVFTSLTMLYFAGVSFAETAHRLGRPELASSFLLHDHPVFGPAMSELIEASRKARTPDKVEAFADQVRRAIDPINVAGLADPQKRNWYPVEAQDLFRNAHKLQASEAEIHVLLARCGFPAGSPNICS